ncbi:fimbrial associated sortase-like protein [Corynebacterium renale]|uniref:class C sortase n=1 Tax=Corynebacterium renale TaxID=1724 RepID=UPI000DA3DD3A|nr:class C sortase [Corynebacterium renale]SQG63484.1 fimbrial associated sortase-like protein [Corynebacterium renale]STD00343.1 fimbrial associated sortase-like protein [Corynebacterium renale]
MSVKQGVSKHARKPKKSFLSRVGLPALIIVVGIVGLLYPVIATQFNNRVQEQVAREYEEHLLDTPEQQLSDAVAEARRYNETQLGGPILDPWLARVAKDNPAYQAYLEQLSGMPAMAQVVVPAIDVRLPVYHGTQESTLQKGLGHLYGTALPVGGEGTHSVITGHTGLTNATLFDDLDQVKVGDAIYVSTFGERLKYEVRQIDIVLPNEVDALGPVPGKDLLTLITCTPYGVNTHRILVHAERVPLDAEEASVLDEETSPVQWWMWLLGAIALVVVIGLLWWIYREQQKQRKLDA